MMICFVPGKFVFVRSRVRVSNANDWLGLKLKSSEGEGREMTCAVLLKEIFLFFSRAEWRGERKGTMDRALCQLIYHYQSERVKSEK